MYGIGTSTLPIWGKVERVTLTRPRPEKGTQWPNSSYLCGLHLMGWVNGAKWVSLVSGPLCPVQVLSPYWAKSVNGPLLGSGVCLLGPSLI